MRVRFRRTFIAPTGTRYRRGEVHNNVREDWVLPHDAEVEVKDGEFKTYAELRSKDKKSYQDEKIEAVKDGKVIEPAKLKAAPDEKEEKPTAEEVMESRTTRTEGKAAPGQRKPLEL